MPGHTTCLRDDGSVQAVTGRLVKLCGGNRSAASAAGVSKSLIHRYTDVHNPPPKGGRKVSVPVAVALDLERACGRPVVTEHMAAVQGYALYRPDWRRVEVVDYPHLSTAFSERAFEAIREANRTLEDGVVEPHEAVAWRHQIRLLMNICARLDVALTAEIDQTEGESVDV